MSIFKKSLLVSTALLLGMQETWSLPLGGQETQEDGQKHPQVSKKEPPKTEELILSPEQVNNLLSYSIPTLFKHKNDFLNKKHPKKIFHTQQEPFQNYDCLERQDHIRLHNIFYLLSHKDFSTPDHSYHWLKNLSLQFDALSVYEDMVRHTVDTALGSNKGLAGKLLSFLHHGLEIEALHPEIKRFIVDAITNSKDLEVLGITLEEIIAFDQTRHKMLHQRKQWLERIEQCKRLPLLPSPAKFEKVSWENLLWEISNSPDLEKIRQEMDNPMLLKEEMETGKRFNRAIGILKTGTFPDTFPELYQSIEEAYESIEKNRHIFNDLRKKILGKKYPTLQFYAGFLYEYENLREIYNTGQSFLPTFDPKNIESRYQLIQCLSILSEGLNGIFLPLGSAQPQEEVISIRGALGFLRNKVFEHPSPTRQQKLEALMVPGAVTDEIFKVLGVEAKIILTKLSARLNYLHSIRSGQSDWQNYLKNLFDLYQKGGKLPDEFGRDESNTPNTLEAFDQLKIWKSSELPLLQSLRRYFIYSSLKVDDITEDSAKIAQQKQAILDLSELPIKEKPRHNWADLDETLNKMRQYIGPGSHRGSLLAKLNESLENRLKAKWILNEFYQILRYLLEHPSESRYLDTINPLYHKPFEYFYLNLRDQRNFQTHDLWRPQDEDLSRLTNVMLSTVSMMDQAFGPRRVPDPAEIRGVKRFRTQNKMKIREDIIQFMTRRGLDVYSIDDHFCTPLHCAVSCENLEVVKILLELRSNVHSMDYKGRTPLNYAASYGNRDLVECLLEAGALPDTKDIAGDNSLALVLKFFGSENGEEKRDFVNLLKHYTSTGRCHNADILHDAVRAHDSTLVQKLLGDGRFPLLYDAEGQLPIILSMEEDVPVDLALEMASALLSHGAPIDQMKYAEKVRALFYAAWDHDHRKVDFLLKQGARPSIPDEDSPLSQAIFTSEESTRLLLEAGANPSICDSIGQPLLLALMNSYSRYSGNVRLLLKYGADSNAADEFGTVLHNVLEHNGQEAAAKMLLEAGAAPFVKGWGGLYHQKTPLLVAQNHLKHFLKDWVSNEAKVIEYQLEEAMQPLLWSSFWKQRVLSLYNGHQVSLKAGGPVLHADCPQGFMDFQVLSKQDPDNFLNVDPNEVVDTILPSIDRVQDLLAEDLLKDKHGFLSDHPHHENLLALMKALKRTKETLRIYRRVCEEDHYLDSSLPDQERLNHLSLNLYPIFKKNFTEALEKKKTLEGNIVSLLLGDQTTLKNYLYNTATSGKWLQATQNGTGILRAYCLLKGLNLVFWDLTETPGEFDLTSQFPMLGLSDRHLVRTMNDGDKNFIALKRMENSH